MSAAIWFLIGAIVGVGLLLWWAGNLEGHEDKRTLERRVRRLNRQAIEEERDDIPEPVNGYGGRDWKVTKH